jgi:hypothetical protein
VNEVLNWPEWVPLSVTLLIVIAGAPVKPVWVKVSVNVLDVLVIVPKSIGLGDTLIVAAGTATPVPVRVTLIGDVLLPVCAICSVADFAPALVGLKVKLTTAVCPRVSVTGVASEAVNWLAFVPVRLMLLIVTGPEPTAPVCVSVTVWAADVALTNTLPKARLLTEAPNVPGTVVGVLVGVGVFVGVLVGVLVLVGVGVLDGVYVAVGVFVGVLDGGGVFVAVGVLVGVFVLDGV